MDLRLKYRLVTKAYLKDGKDGYQILKKCEVLVSEEECPELCTSIQNHFEAIKILTGNNDHRHRQSLICVSRRHSVVKMFEMGGGSPGEAVNINSSPMPLVLPNIRRSPDPGRRVSRSRRTSIDEIEFEQTKLEPKIEGRILILTEEVKLQLQYYRK